MFGFTSFFIDSNGALTLTPNGAAFTKAVVSFPVGFTPNMSANADTVENVMYNGTGYLTKLNPLSLTFQMIIQGIAVNSSVGTLRLYSGTTLLASATVTNLDATAGILGVFTGSDPIKDLKITYQSNAAGNLFQMYTNITRQVY